MRTLAQILARWFPIHWRRPDRQDAALAERYGPGAEYVKTAAREDIFYCFRLLLGRNPNPEEWPGHSARAGEDLENVVRSYVTSREFADRRLLNTTYLDKVELVHFPSFSLFASVEDLAVGNHVVIGRSYDPAVAMVLRRYVKPGMAVLDIGANIGCLTMLSASLVGPLGLVVAIEPNPENVKLLEASRRVNGFDQVLVIQAAAGRQTGLLALNVSYSNGMTAALPDDVGGLFASRPVPCFALDALLPKARRLDLIKIDVEGAEPLVVEGAQATIERDRPIILTEILPSQLQRVCGCSPQPYFDFFLSRHYRGYIVDGVRCGEEVKGFPNKWDKVLVNIAFIPEERAVDLAIFGT